MISILVLDISNVTNLFFDWLVFVINSNRSKIFAGRTGKEKNIKIFFLITKLAQAVVLENQLSQSLHYCFESAA